MSVEIIYLTTMVIVFMSSCNYIKRHHYCFIGLFENFMTASISQGRVATCFRCGGILNDHFLANLLLNVAVKKLQKLDSVIGKDMVDKFYMDIF